MALPDGPGPSRLLMQLTWVAGAIGFWLGFGNWQNGDIAAATSSVTLWIVGVVGIGHSYRACAMAATTWRMHEGE